MIALRSGREVPAANWLMTSQRLVGVAIGLTDPPADALDRTPNVEVLVVEPGRANNVRGETAMVGGMELVIDLGPVAAPANVHLDEEN